MQVYYYFAIHSWQTHVSRVCNHGDEILTYGYVKPRDQWFPIEETPRPTPPGSSRGSGAIPIRYARAHPVGIFNVYR
jgi:hypothetical protein